MKRQGGFSRKTGETDIAVDLCLDGSGIYEIETSIPFLDHMLCSFSKHSFFDLRIKAAGDTQVDLHHTVEDIGICLGEALRRALGEKQGLRRFGEAAVPMIDALAWVAVDLSGRCFLKYRVSFPASRVGEMDVELFEEFFRAFSNHGGLDLHVHLLYGSNAHHSVEAIFKAAARALDQACRLDPRQTGILSTKGSLDL